MVLLVIVIIFSCAPHVYSHCYGAGQNPGFSGAPTVKQLTPWKVRVSWAEVATQRKCADHFLVKYWESNHEPAPRSIMVSELVGQNVHFMDLDVSRNVQYTFVVVAREIKKLFGVQWDTDDNHSPPVVFRTSFNPGKLHKNLTKDRLIYIALRLCAYITFLFYPFYSRLHLGIYRAVVKMLNDMWHGEQNSLSDHPKTC